MTSELRAAYQKLRHAAVERGRRLEAAGFKAPEKPKSSRGLTESQIAKEYAKLQKWMARETSTVKGARAAKERKNEQRRERRRQQREERRETERRAAERQAAIERDIERGLAGRDEEAARALRNLRKGLEKYGIPINSYAQLAAWGDYIKERKNDSNRAFYMFDQWLDEAEEAIGKDRAKIDAEDVYNMILDFSAWSMDRSNLEAEYNRERQPNEYSAEDIGDMWDVFMNR